MSRTAPAGSSRPDGRSRSESSATVSRRDVLRGVSVAFVGVAAGGALSGCGLRWESDAPELPVLARDRHAGADALRRELAHVEAARISAASARDRIAVAAHTDQLQALTERLGAVHDLRPGEPAAPAPPPPIAPAPTAHATLAGPAAADAAWAGLDLAATTRMAASGADEQDLLLISSVQVSRLALGRRLGGRWADPLPTDGIADISPEAVPGLLDTARRTTYVLDVSAARAPADLTSAATGSREAALRLLVDLDAASRTATTATATAASTPPPPLGYPLDENDLSTPAGVSALAARALADVSDALVAAMPGEWRRAGKRLVDQSEGAPQGLEAAKPVVALRRRAAECEQWHTAWSSEVRSLPGLR